MTGSLQIKNNKYYAVLNTVDENGKRKQKWICTNLQVRGNKKNAQKILEKLEEEYDERNINYSDVYVFEYFTDWLERIKGTVERSTYSGYSGNMNGHIIPYFRRKKIKLQDLKPYHLEDYYSSLLNGEKPLSPQTVRHHHRNISKALNDAVRHDIIPSNPAQRATLPKAKRYIGSFLNPEQLKQMLLLFNGTEIENPIRFITTYGVRRSEALGLCWDKVDFENGQFTIAKSMIQCNGTGFYLKDCAKNDSSYRTLPMTNDIKIMLEDIKNKQSENRAFLGNSYKENDFVFTWPDGSPITPNYVTKIFHKKIKESDLPTVRLHDLRHSTASNLLANGFSVVEVQHWLGHSQASTTLNFYSHVDSSSKQNIKNALEKMV